MSIEGIRLRNFRGFRDVAIEIKPLTVLLGPNSSGKSSFGHALAAMAHAHWLHTGSAQATLSPRRANEAQEWPIDLGMYNDLRTEGSTERVCIDVLLNTGRVALGFGGVLRVPDLRLSYIEHPTSDQPVLTVQPELPFRTPTALSEMGKEIRLVSSGTPDVIRLTRRDEVTWVDSSGAQAQVGLDGLVLNTVELLAGATTSVRLQLPSRNGLRDVLQNLTYLRGSRKRPSRGYDVGRAARQAVGYAGEFATAVYNDERATDVNYVRLEPSASGKQSRDSRSWKPRNETKTLEDAVDFWLHHLGLAATAEAAKSKRYPGTLELRVALQAKRRALDVTEVGFGISQVFPVLVAGLLQSEKSVFVVDLPEAHLHPRPQARIADFFCSLALSGRHSIVETHSDMLFHQLRLRAAMYPELAELIRVYFIDEPSSDGVCSPPRVVGLGAHDEVEWPVGFLDEAFHTENQIKLARRSKRS
jgi:predicted ATPase